MGLLRVAVMLVGVLFTLWVFSIFAPAIIEPLNDQAHEHDAVADEGYSDDVDTIEEVVLKDAPTLLGGGFVVLVIIYAVWRERFDRRRRI